MKKLLLFAEYASGILKPRMLNNDVKDSEAAASIFKKFKFRAEK